MTSKERSKKYRENELDKVRGYWRKRKYRFTIVIKPNLNILNLDTITKEEELEIVKKLDTQNEREYKNFMKYINGESKYDNFWQYIRMIYGYNNGFKSRDDFMKLGYDGICSEKEINSYEPQIVIFELKNITVVKKEETKDIFVIGEYYDKIFTDLNNVLKEYVPNDFEIKTEDYTEYEKRYSNNLYKYIFIQIINGKKDFSISIKGFSSGNSKGNINVEINPHIRNDSGSMGANLDMYDPDWNYFSTRLSTDLKTAVEQIKMD
jgi:hypothetical protein